MSSSVALATVGGAKVPKTKRSKKSLEDAAEALAAVAEQALSKLTPEEQEARVAAFARVRFTSVRESPSKSSSSERTLPCPVFARGRE